MCFEFDFQVIKTDASSAQVHPISQEGLSPEDRHEPGVKPAGVDPGALSGVVVHVSEWDCPYCRHRNTKSSSTVCEKCRQEKFEAHSGTEGSRGTSSDTSAHWQHQSASEAAAIPAWVCAYCKTGNSSAASMTCAGCKQEKFESLPPGPPIDKGETAKSSLFSDSLVKLNIIVSQELLMTNCWIQHCHIVVEADTFRNAILQHRINSWRYENGKFAMKFCAAIIFASLLTILVCFHIYSSR